MTLLEICMKAELPLLKITTEDTLNIKEVISYYTGKPVPEITDKKTLEKTKAKYMITYMDPGDDIETTYTYLVNEERCLIFVNIENQSPLIFDAGELPTPIALVEKHLLSVVDAEDLPKLMPTLGGLNLKQITEVARLSMAMEGKLSARGIMATRRSLLTRLKGIMQVDTTLPFYIPSKSLTKWVDDNANIFLKCPDPRLIPRGILFMGDPGTGKTQGAKYIANELQVPLYLINLGSMLGKYVGDSEANLRQALSQVDREEPCILLLDEVEKIFKTSDDNGVVTRLLAYLLWWMQEHKSRVLTIMTTNNMEILPAELYRAGRIDSTYKFEGLDKAHGGKFAMEVLGSFAVPLDAHNSMQLEIYKAIGNTHGILSQAEITQIVIDVIKSKIKHTYM